MRPCEWRREAARLANIESETSIERGIAENKDSLPPGGLAVRNSLTDQFVCNACPPVFGQHRDGAQRQRGKRRVHPREHGMTGDDAVHHGNQREHGIASSTQILDQPGFVAAAKRDFFNDTDRRDIAGCFEPDHHFTPASP